MVYNIKKYFQGEMDMRNGASRFYARENHRRDEKRKIFAARAAVGTFRRDGDPSGFPDLEVWLNRHGIDLVSYDLSGFGRDDTWGLTEDEYGRMKAAYESSLVAVTTAPEDYDN